jgi:hypothetical protein
LYCTSGSEAIRQWHHEESMALFETREVGFIEAACSATTRAA